MIGSPGGLRVLPEPPAGVGTLKMQKTLNDEKWMREAIRMARCGLGKTRPNPPVGAVVVRSGRVVGRGYHKRAGSDHAEVVALKEAGALAKGATLYVTLEPCSTSGRTPPCTRAIVASGVARVVVPVRDPNPAHNGRGIMLLKRAGIDVAEGVCRPEGSALIAPFSKWVRTGMPYVTLKLGTSIDGKISDWAGTARWITSAASRRLVKQLRAEADAVMVGSSTVRIDDPSLLPDVRSCSTPMRVVVCSRGRLPLSAKLFNDGKVAQTVVATTKRCPAKVAGAYAAAGAEVWHVPAKDTHVSLRALLRKMGRQGLLHVLCEGGGTLAENLVRERLVDEVLFMIAPRILGGTSSTPAIAGRGWLLASAPQLEFTEVRRIGPDVLVRGRFRELAGTML